MTDIGKINEKPKEKFKDGIRSIFSGKSIGRSADVLRANFGGQWKPRFEDRAHPEQIAERPANLCQQKGQLPDQEKAWGSQAEAELKQEARSNLKEE